MITPLLTVQTAVPAQAVAIGFLSHRPRLNFRRICGGFWQFGTCLVLSLFLIVACSITGSNTICHIVIDTNIMFRDRYVDHYTV
jgi:hypothetical protein